MYNYNNPSNWSWTKAFDEMAKTVNKSELTQQVINHLGDYKGITKYIDLPKEKQDELYNVLYQIL
jgi:histidyl-tRNA synthetase